MTLLHEVFLLRRPLDPIPDHPGGADLVNLTYFKPEGADLTATQQAAMEADVGYHPGVNFSPDGVSGKNCARLCFGYNTPEEIHEGISRLAEVFDKAGYLAG